MLSYCCCAQEFSFTVSCGNKRLSTNSDSEVSDKLDKLLDVLYDDVLLANSTKARDIILSKKLNNLTCLPSSYVPNSCKDIQDKWPSSTSGYYIIATANGCTSTVYCHMEDLCDTPDLGLE